MKKAKSKEKDAVLKSDKLSELKKEYEEALNELASLAEDNTVFYTSKEQWDVLNNKYDYHCLEIDKKVVSEDIIKTIVPLKRFVDIQNKFEVILYKEYLTMDICMRYWYMWQNVYVDEEEKDETTLKAHKSCIMQVKAIFDVFVDIEWSVLCKKYPKYKTQENSNMFKKMAYDDTEVYNEFTALFVETFRLLSLDDGYMQLQNELYHFFDDLKVALEKPEWLDHLTYSGYLGMYSSIRLSNLENIEDSCILKIRELYKAGALKGKLNQLMVDEI